MADEIALLVADVYDLAGLLRRIGDTMAAPEGQTQARWQLLSAISEHPETVSRAARRLGVTRQAVQRVANELVHERLAEYRDNPDHRGSPLLALTDAGRDALTAINRRAQAFHRRLAHRLGPSRVSALRADVQRFIAVLADEE